MEQETLLQYYAKELGVESDRSPVCHPEIGGEGIEFDWGCAKVHYRSQPIKKKRSKDNFKALVKESLGGTVLTIKQCRSNARRAWMYMLAYKALEDSYNIDDKSTEKNKLQQTQSITIIHLLKSVLICLEEEGHIAMLWIFIYKIYKW